MKPLCDHCGKEILADRAPGKSNLLHRKCAGEADRLERMQRGAFLVTLAGLFVSGANFAWQALKDRINGFSSNTSGLKLLDYNFVKGLDQNLLSSNDDHVEWLITSSAVIPRGLKLFGLQRRPGKKLELRDYEVSFLCSVDNGAIGWVCRAQDHQNHFDFVLSKSQSNLTITRFRTVDGRRQELGSVPVSGYSNVSLLRVTTTAQDDLITIHLVGDKDAPAHSKVVDTWPNIDVRHGTFGFFAESSGSPVLYSYFVKNRPGVG